MTQAKKNTIRSVERALELLLCFLDRKSWTLTELTKQTGLHKSTVFRLLATLEEKGFLHRDAETERYSLGLKIWELSLQLDLSTDPAVLFLNEMEMLRDQVDETVSLYIRDGLKRIRIQAVESRQAIRRVAPIGAKMSLAVGASSKILIAFSPPDLLAELIKSENWPDYVEVDRYRQEIAEVKRLGYAISFEEREAGTAAIAVPIINRQGLLLAALAVSGPVTRLSRERMLDLLPQLQEKAVQMGQRI